VSQYHHGTSGLDVSAQIFASKFASNFTFSISHLRDSGARQGGMHPSLYEDGSSGSRDCVDEIA
jgi:hypothetical protein